MSFNRTSLRVAIGLFAILLASPTFGQGPLGFQIFAPADVSTYGGAIEPNEGYFFQFDGLYWSVSAPKATPVGFPNLTRNVFYGPITSPIPNPHSTGGDVPSQISQAATQSNTLDTSGIPSEFSAGNRFEFGRVEDRNGWFASIYQLLDQEQDFVFPSANIVLQDTPYGPAAMQHLQGGLSDAGPAGNLPATIYNVAMSHAVDTWGVELMYLHRFRTCHKGGTFEFFTGPRYLEFNDRFGITVGSSTNSLIFPSYLAGSSWDSAANNHIVGGEVGARWFKKQGRWMLSTEGRFFAGLNYQNINQEVTLGPNLNPGPPTQGSIGTTYQPMNMGATTSTYGATAREFSPGIELRLEGRYQITRAISFHAGWTGLWLDGIARGDAVIDYTLASNGQVFGIDLSRNRENLFINGLTLGFDVNR